MTPRKKASISRGAAGLPRYYMDCGWYRHPNFAGLPLDSLALFEAMIGYSCEHATDGRLPGHHEDLAAALGLRASAVKKALRPLLDRGRVAVEDDHHQVVGFSSHNPTADEIDAFIEERSTSGARGNHIRHHVNKGRWSADCEFCPAADPRLSDPNSDGSSDPTAVATGSHGLGGVGLGVPPQVLRSGATTPSDVVGAEAPPEEDRPPNPRATATAAVEHIAACDLERAKADGQIIRSDKAWLAKATENRRPLLEQLAAAAERQPGIDPVDLAEQLDPAFGPLDGGAARADARWHADKAQLDAEAAEAERLRNQRLDAQAHLEEHPDLRADLTAKAQAEHPNAGPGLLRQHVIRLAIAHLEEPPAA